MTIGREVRVKGHKEFKGVWWDVLSFIFFLSLAFFLQWKTSDLVWSLWLGSLVIGYVTLLSNIGAGAAYLLSERTEQGGMSVALVLSGVGGGLFLLAFFSVHFGMFHFIHSVFLNQFFPLERGIKGVFTLSTFGVLFFSVILPKYGLFLIPALISQRRDLLRAWKQAPHVFASASRSTRKERRSQKGAHLGGALMAAPYKNVVRMHLLIFFFAGMTALKCESFLVYAIVYTVYFFPWGVFMKRLNT